MHRYNLGLKYLYSFFTLYTLVYILYMTYTWLLWLVTWKQKKMYIRLLYMYCINIWSHWWWTSKWCSVSIIRGTATAFLMGKHRDWLRLQISTQYIFTSYIFHILLNWKDSLPLTSLFHNLWWLRSVSWASQLLLKFTSKAAWQPAGHKPDLSIILFGALSLQRLKRYIPFPCFNVS